MRAKWIALARYAALFALTLALLLGLMAAAGSVPRAKIRENAGRSAQWFVAHALFPDVLEGQAFTRADHYADAVLFNIIYCVDEAQPLSSSLAALYHSDPHENENYNFLAAVEGGAPNASYARYWHGSMVWLRPLLLWLDYNGIRALHAAVLGLLLLALCALLLRRRMAMPAAVLLAALLLCSAWVVPFSIEYTTTFLVALPACMACLCLERRGDAWVRGALFLCGMLACFVDFLTTETLTLLLPLTLVLLARHQEGRLRGLREELRFVLGAVLLWGGAYALMWVTKWLLAAAVTGTDALAVALEMAAQRVSGALEEGVQVNRFFGALMRNLSCVLPFPITRTYGQGLLLLCGLGLAALCVVYLGRRDIAQKKTVLALLLGLGLIPPLRYLLLSNHSYLHYFFTYRALIATLLAWGGALCISLRGETPGKKRRAERRRP